MFRFIVNVCRLIRTLDHCHLIPCEKLFKEGMVFKETPDCIVRYTRERNINKRVNPKCNTLFSYPMFFDVYKHLKPFIVQPVKGPITNKGRNPKYKGWLEVTPTPPGQTREPMNELELFVAVVSTLLGLAVLHKLGISHRDVRAQRPLQPGDQRLVPHRLGDGSAVWHTAREQRPEEWPRPMTSAVPSPTCTCLVVEYEEVEEKVTTRSKPKKTHTKDSSKATVTKKRSKKTNTKTKH
ncbi:hypothetical protein Pelo_13633 [Pelomyxa schiedti]|nr:hypothetical protein Pelo_13633 [Pelomyxa schiedti]